MKVFLLHKDRDFDPNFHRPSNEEALTQDLHLSTLLNAMALGDKFLLEVAKNAIFSGLGNDPESIRYRQDILKDCINNSALVRSLYSVAVELHERKKRDYYWIFRDRPSTILYSSINMMNMFLDMLKKLKNIAQEHANKFKSEGFTAFFAMLNKELDDDYFACIENHLKELEFRNGVLISAELKEGNEGGGYLLHRQPFKKQGWLRQLFSKQPTAYTFQIAERDEAGARALSELKDRGIGLVANALAQSADHILSFFKMLQAELAFYMGCLNLHDRLNGIKMPVSFPHPELPGRRKFSFQGLYDPCLALVMNRNIVGSDVDADKKILMVITGANQGGKSTFLRSIGIAQLMMQCGMFVPAECFCSSICDGLFTHFKREEDITMNSGKLDEELSRMNEIINNLTPNPMVLLNESFAATNEREGSEIARQITGAMLEKRIRVAYVTHLYDFASSIYNKQMENAIFLRAERQDDGDRTFKVIKGRPLQTSYGEDLYKTIFGKDI